ncbi:MAG: nitroreductase family protein [Candidatus Hodarchaeota archaeon]
MDLFEAIKRRRSIRKYMDEDVLEEDLEKILEAAILAPSAGNRQAWDFVIVRDESVKKALVKAALGQNFIAEAPVVVVVCANMERSASRYGSRGSGLYCIQDTAAAIQNMLLAVTALGLGACWIGAFHEEGVTKILELPIGVRPVAIIPIGHPAKIPRPTPRFRLSEVLHYEKW